MSMKRILGTMLATRMGGRGRNVGALGTASAIGLLGSRGGLGSKLGLAGLGYMAYQAYQNSQRRHAGNTGGQQGGGLIDKLRDTAQEILAGGSADSRQSAGTTDASGTTHASGDEELRKGEVAAGRISEDEALLMIRAMITAAYSDGSLSQEERGRIMQAIEEADATAAEREIMECEIANPKPLDALLTQIDDTEAAEEFYMASRAALNGDRESDQRYLSDLQTKLGISDEVAAEANSIAS
ncbi:hypothetical protein P775_00720 [Puniceibacterium antarcticum]|uniref:Protein YebE n=1 Tax=Puniceibacterium antarcticum TaxID=1206336 RepID=A0A2G8RKS8_9RHOB|nr:DUF533 domain-containing protein [Puniceibacterium antarcticum]PIL22157.1 hypothetical protein P775_00720 [Puniceibacterium antarcticum]